MSRSTKQKVIVVGAGPVGALAALYAAGRGDQVEVYELRDGQYTLIFSPMPPDYYSEHLIIACISSLCMKWRRWSLRTVNVVFHTSFSSHIVSPEEISKGSLHSPYQLKS